MSGIRYSSALRLDSRPSPEGRNQISSCTSLPHDRHFDEHLPRSVPPAFARCVFIQEVGHTTVRMIAGKSCLGLWHNSRRISAVRDVNANDLRATLSFPETASHRSIRRCGRRRSRCRLKGPPRETWLRRHVSNRSDACGTLRIISTVLGVAVFG